MSAGLVLVTHDRFADHVAAPGHPERPERLAAALAGVADIHLGDDLVALSPRRVDPDVLGRVHDPVLVDCLRAVAERGGGRLDADTGMSSHSWEAACLAAGAGLVAVEALDDGRGVAAFCAVRPPGHHATADRAMGFCLLNSVAVTARALADRGERVLIVDYDAHHGNGTQDIFYDDPHVLFVSFHQWPLYPGTGAANETGRGPGEGATVNLPVPPGATGDVYERAWDEVVAAVVDAFEPTYLLLSAGFDGHRRDPLTDLGLTSADFGRLTRTALAAVPAGRAIAFLEGGYDLAAVRACTAAAAGALVGDPRPTESPSSGGPGAELVDDWARHHRRG